MPTWIVDCPALYNRDGGPYQDASGADWEDNPLRFGQLSRVAALLGAAESPVGWRAQLVHANDWQTGLAPAYAALTGDSGDAKPHHDSQPLVSRHLRSALGRRPRFAGSELHDRRRRVPRRFLVPQSRAQIRERHHDGQSHLRGRDPARSDGNGAARPARRSARRALRHSERHRRDALEPGDRCLDPGAL